MTRLHSISTNLTPSIGNTSDFSLPWSVFVEYVIDLTVEAYENMRDNARLHQNMHEEQISVILADDYITEAVNSRIGPHLIVNTEVRVIEETMKSGEKHIRQAQKIDIKLYGSWQRDYNKIYFAWECKKISDRETNSNLITEYVSEGIFRFCDGNYSPEVENAGMIGYVLNGDVNKIVTAINESMTNAKRERRLPISAKLEITSPRRSLDHIYESSHTRLDRSAIKLHHLFLTFIYLPQGTDGSTETTS